MIKVIGISDIHGQLPKIEEEFDLLLIGGDIAPNYRCGAFFECEYQRGWFSNEFVPWVMSLPFKDEHSKVVFIAGNHDFYLYSESDAYKVGYSSIWTDIITPCYNRLVYLYDSEYLFEKGDEKLRIYGTPWCKEFGNWAFMINNEKLKTAFEKIPEGLDILLTHDAPALPPYGFITEGRWKGEDAGNKPLSEAIKLKKPTYALHGHIHSSPHEITNPADAPDTKVACLSILNETYHMTYKPLVFELEGKKDGNNG